MAVEFIIHCIVCDSYPHYIQLFLESFRLVLRSLTFHLKIVIGHLATNALVRSGSNVEQEGL